MFRGSNRWFVVLVTVAVMSAGAVHTFAADILKSDDLVAVCGDSITEQKDYSVDIEAYLLMCRAAGPVRTAQFGWSGDDVVWIFNRGSEKDIVSVHPTVVTTCYGMNDGRYGPITDQVLNTYRDGMKKLIATFKENGVRTVVIGSPGVVDSFSYRRGTNESEVYNKTLAALRDIDRELAKENGFPFANVHDVMMDVMVKAKAKYGPEYTVAGGDGVHPASNGQLVMAYAFLKAMGCDGEIGTISVDMASGKATATDGHKVVSSANGSVALESTRYPFCFWGKPADPGATSGIIEFFPFNEDLNRLKLIVTNAPAGQVKVTWGDGSKVYTSDQLAKGVNLAADFLENPFTAQFGKIRLAISRKQQYETALYKTFMANAKMVNDAIKDAELRSDAYDVVKTALIKRDAKLAAELATQVTPVAHTIQIEPVR